ncbi:hypothetical protein ACTWP5_05450 [Streptomyces sp. 4N509B]|uniref:hypothetical protein n=1 Tax=Streptomyces sp. 4N509B TaxID=3457413 RepID=UPI003FD2546B
MTRLRSAAPDDGFSNPPRHWLRAVWLVGAVVVGSLVAYAVIELPDRLDCRGGSHLTNEAGECLGVTDGSPAFLPRDDDHELADEFERVQELIKAENDRVAAEADTYAKVGLMSTLSPDETSPLGPDQVLHALEGAYIAQWRANHTRQLGDPEPQIQLHLANVGGRHQGWRPAVDQLVEMADDPAPLVAVAGLSISTEDSRAAARELARHDIPIIGASASADGLNSETVEGLVRVTPSNTDFVTALHRYATDREGLDEAILVYDQKAPDLHVRTLTEAFEEQFATELGTNPAQPFQGETLERDSSAALFDPAVRNICEVEADMVLFAGRIGDLGNFIDALHSRACRDGHLSVLFADTGPLIRPGEHERLVDSRLTIVQASAMDPSWPREAGETPDAPAGFADFYREYDARLSYVPDVPAALADGYAAANHDAMAVATQAVRVTHAQDSDSPMTGARVRDALFLLHLGNAVQTAGGTLHFTTERNGDPGGKPIAIQEAPPGETPPDLYMTPAP